MAKRKRTNIHRGNENRYTLIPRGKAYQPFILIQDIASMGRSSRPCGIKTSRKHEFLSDLERNFFMMLEFCDDVVDIREQFPLNIKETLLIADELGLKHPMNSETKQAYPMTSDFCITLKLGSATQDIIRTAKYKIDLLDRRTIEKFMIEQVYWERHGLDWGIVTEEDVNKDYSQNLDDILDYYTLNDNYGFKEMSEVEREDIVIVFLQRIIDANKNMRPILSQLEKDLNLLKGAGIAMFKHLVARKYISIDLFSPLCLDRHIKIELLRKSRELGEVIS